MKHGKFEKVPSASSGKKRLTLLVCLILMAALSVGATMAYFQMTTQPVINTFHAGSVGAEISETVDGNTKTVIQVTNKDGTFPVYVRVRLVSYYETSEGGVDVSRASPGVSVSCNTNHWVQNGNYYYYTKPLAGGATTENLLAGGITMEAGQVIEVLADTVQASPSDAAREVWGYVPSGN